MTKNLNHGLLVLILLLASCNVNFQHLQTGENKYDLTTTEQLKDEAYAERIEEFYSNGEEGRFAGQAGLSIYYNTFIQEDDEKAAILISAGRTEAAIKFKELIYDLYNNGFSVYIHDHRGQGQSGRMTEDPEMGYVDNFQYYIDDMKQFYDSVLVKRDHKKVYLLTHSMGGAIGMTYIEQYPGDFNAAAFSSPMLGLKPPGCAIAKLFSGKDAKYAPGQSGYNDDKVPFDKNTLTGSRTRYKRMNAAFAEMPEARLGGVTYRWLFNSCKQFGYMKDNINKIETPFILFSAENEQIVDPLEHQRFVKKAKEAGVDCKAYVVEDAQHEILMEKDEQRTETLNEILNFYSNY